MRRLLFALAAVLLLGMAGTPYPAGAQVLADTVFAWRDYGRTARCRVRIYQAPPEADRTRVVVLEELAENGGASTLDDARHLVDLLGRHFDVAPEDALWVFHWGAFSFEGARPDGRKELFLRATFRRGSGGALGTPSWRLVTRAEVEDYTDRLFR